MSSDIARKVEEFWRAALTVPDGQEGLAQLLAGRPDVDPRRATRGRDLDHDRGCTHTGRHRAPMTSPVTMSTTPCSSSAASGSSSSAPLLRVLLTSVEIG